MAVKFTIVEIVCAVCSTIASIGYTIAIVVMCTQKISLDKTLKLIMVILGTAIYAKAIYNYFALFGSYKNETPIVQFELWNLQIRSMGLMHIAFTLVVIKIIYLLVAFSRRRLSISLKLIKRSNRLIMWIGTIFFAGTILSDLVLLILIESSDYASLNTRFLVKLSLAGLILSAVSQFFMLFLLWPMSRMFKKALKLQKLTSYFKEKRFPRYSVRTFVISYVARALIIICHGVWAII